MSVIMNQGYLTNKLSLLLCLLLTSGCLAGGALQVSGKSTPVEGQATAEKKPIEQQEVLKQETPDDPVIEKEDRPVSKNAAGDIPAPFLSPPQAHQDPGQPSADQAEQRPSPGPLPMTNQALLDLALDFCQTSNDFWEQGDLDNALDALDKAYSLILKVNHDDNPEVLRQKEDLRFTISKRINQVYSSRFIVANGFQKAIPLVMNSHVKRALDLFTGREKKFFLISYRRSGRYRPAIVKALKEAGLPEELSWLPLIESGFKVRALSRARALGLWQFIASTGYKFGLKRDRWVDERMDPEKSTRAAVAYLKELHQIFGDWTTVLAAYNSGEWTVLKRIRTQRINYLDNFWDLYRRLPRETAFYVPKFLAVLHILNDPKAYGITLPPVDEEIKVEKVNINKQVHLKTIAKSLGMSYQALYGLNPELRRQATPDSPYLIKTPAGKGKILLAKLNDLPVWRPPVPAYVIHRVRNGESLSVISQRYKTSVRAIMAMNGLKKRHFVRAGRKLKIPTRRRIASRAPRPPSHALKSMRDTLEYTVRRGDSLWKIANKFQTTTKVIRSINLLRKSALRTGQVLRIPSPPTAPNPDEIKKYRVKEGDSPYLIAKRYEMNLAEFLKLNKLTPRTTIFPGQIVKIKAE